MTTIKRLFVTYPSLRKFWKEVEQSAILVFAGPALVGVGGSGVLIYVFIKMSGG